MKLGHQCRALAVGEHFPDSRIGASLKRTGYLVYNVPIVEHFPDSRIGASLKP